MKKVFILFAFLLSACACTCAEETVVAPEPAKPEPKPVVYANSYTPTYTSRNTCNTCTTSYTVSKPVEVIYKDITYTTVYEPKTYEEVSYSRKPYNKCENSDLCY